MDQLLDQAITKGDLDEVNRLETWLWLDGPGQAEGRVQGLARSLAVEMNEIILRNDVPEESGASNLDAWARVDDLRAPTIVACGDLDVPFLMKQSRELADRLLTSTFVQLEGVAHLPQLERPAEIANLVLQAVS